MFPTLGSWLYSIMDPALQNKSECWGGCLQFFIKTHTCIFSDRGWKGGRKDWLVCKLVNRKAPKE